MSSSEAYAWTILNTMRADPVKFANDLEGMYKRTISSAHGYSVNDPIWKDIREGIANSRHKEPRFNMALTLLRAQPRLGPLAWEDRLETMSDEHNTWMRNYGYTHSLFDGGTGTLPRALPGFTQQTFAGYDPVNATVLGSAFNVSWGENIGYSTGSLSNTKNSYSVGSSGYRQRQAYKDIVDFIIEVNNSSADHPLGHLENLLGRDTYSNSGFGLAGGNKSIGYKNAIGIGYTFYDSNASTGNTSQLTTHTLSQHKQYSGLGGYIAGIAYSDKNGNGAYDIGEGVQVGWEIETPGGLGVGYDTTASNYGVISDFQTENGIHTIRALSGGRVLGSRIVNIQDNNVWVEFQVSSGFGLTDTTTPTLTADLYEGSSGNNTQSTATNIGTATRTSPLLGRSDALSLHTTTDQDWFKFSLAERSAVAVDLTFRHSDSDVDATLYRQNADGTLTSVRGMGSTSDRESYAADLDAGTYVLKVYSFNSKSTFYSLQVAAEPLSYATVTQSGESLTVTTDAFNHRLVLQRVGTKIDVTGLGATRVRNGSTGAWTTKATVNLAALGTLRLTLGIGHDDVVLRDLSAVSIIYSGGAGNTIDSLTLEALTRDVFIADAVSVQMGQGGSQFQMLAKNGFDISVTKKVAVVSGTDISSVSSVSLETVGVGSVIAIGDLMTVNLGSGGDLTAFGNVHFLGGLQTTLGGEGGVRLLPNGGRILVRKSFIVTSGNGHDWLEIGEGAAVQTQLRWNAGNGNDAFRLRSSASLASSVSDVITLSLGEGNNQCLILGSASNPVPLSKQLKLTSGAGQDSVQLKNVTLSEDLYISTGGSPTGSADSVTLDGVVVEKTTSVRGTGAGMVVNVQTQSVDQRVSRFVGSVGIALTGASTSITFGTLTSGVPVVSFLKSVVLTGGTPALRFRNNRRNVSLADSQLALVRVVIV